MNSMERVGAALAGSPVDRRPVTMLLSLYGARLTNCPLSQYFSEAAAYADGQSAVRQTFAPDILFAPFAFAAIAAAFGCEMHEFPDQAPIIRHPAINHLDDLDRLVIPQPSHPRLAYFSEAIRLMVKHHGRDVPIAGVLPGVTDLPALIVGMDAWMEAVLFDVHRTQPMIDLMLPFIIDFANSLIEAGATFIAMPGVFTSPAIVPREVVANFTLPIMEKMFSGIRGPVVLHHGGAPFLQHLDLVCGLPHLAGVALDHRDDLEKSRAILGPDLVLLGGLNGPALNGMPAAQIKKTCCTILKNRRDDPRFILYSAGPDIPYNTPPENILAIKDAVDECLV